MVLVLPTGQTEQERHGHVEGPGRDPALHDGRLLRYVSKVRLTIGCSCHTEGGRRLTLGMYRVLCGDCRGCKEEDDTDHVTDRVDLVFDQIGIARIPVCLAPGKGRMAQTYRSAYLRSMRGRACHMNGATHMLDSTPEAM